MIFFRESMTVREEDLMRLMEIEDANSPFIGDIISSIYNDAARLIDGAEIAAEVMRMALLAPKDGKPSIAIGTGNQRVTIWFMATITIAMEHISKSII